jgi:rare lipoprotein A
VAAALTLYRLLPLLPALVLVGCGSSGGYRGDGTPSRVLDPDKIQDAVPRRDPITSAGNKNPYTVLGKTYRILPSAKGYKARGTASWYGTKFHGESTANGERYDVYEMTAAHCTLPIPTYVQVTNLENGRRAIVRVNDRGPFVNDRIIDLSYAAAVKLGYANKGTAPVEVVAIDMDNWPPSKAVVAAPPPAPAPAAIASDARQSETVSNDAVSAVGRYYVQAGAFQSAQIAENLRLRLAAATRYPVLVEPAGALYRVRVGPLISRAEAELVRGQLLAGPASEARIVEEAAPVR